MQANAIVGILRQFFQSVEMLGFQWKLTSLKKEIQFITNHDLDFRVINYVVYPTPAVHPVYF